MQRFCDPIVCYLEFLVTISSTQIVSWMLFCPPDRLPVIRVVLFYLKTNFLRSRIFRTSCRSQDTFCYLYRDILAYLL